MARNEGQTLGGSKAVGRESQAGRAVRDGWRKKQTKRSSWVNRSLSLARSVE